MTIQAGRDVRTVSQEAFDTTAIGVQSVETGLLQVAGMMDELYAQSHWAITVGTLTAVVPPAGAGVVSAGTTIGAHGSGLDIELPPGHSVRNVRHVGTFGGFDATNLTRVVLGYTLDTFTAVPKVEVPTAWITEFVGAPGGVGNAISRSPTTHDDATYGARLIPHSLGRGDWIDFITNVTYSAAGGSDPAIQIALLSAPLGIPLLSR